MSILQFFRSNRGPISVNAIGATIGTVAGALLIYLGAVFLKGAPAVWQWILQHQTVALLLPTFLFGLWIGVILRSKRQPMSTNPEGKLSKRPANLFWLGNDLRYAREMAKDSGRSNILQGLKQAMHHSSELGLNSTPAASMLRELTEEVERSHEPANDAVRAALGKEVLSVTDAFSELLKKYQRIFDQTLHVKTNQVELVRV